MAATVPPKFPTKERYALVDKALWTTVGEVPRNVLTDVLPSAASSKFVNKADGKEYTLEFSSKLTRETLDDVYKLLNENMREHYEESGWGWNEKKKLRELKEDDARFLLLRDAEDQT
jgi:hypothetical protein